jgi:hypothetical protein
MRQEINNSSNERLAMTMKVPLSAQQIQDLREHNQSQIPVIVGAAKANIIADGQFVFFAAFDGTNNDMNHHPNDKYDTNVAQLWSQYVVARSKRANLGGGYYAGVGTDGTLTHSEWLPPNVTQQAIVTAQKAYDEFCVQASDWLRMSGNAGKPVAVAITSFSRGGASAAIFSQMLYARGLADPKNGGKVLVPPGRVPISAGVLFDPVTTGISVNLAFAPNAKNIVDIEALNEYRQLFKGADYFNQPGVIAIVPMYGNHCDIGGGYDLGLSALALEAATGFLKKSGLPISDVPSKRRFNPNEVAVHSEEYDDRGNKIWDVYNTDGFSFKNLRLLVSVAIPATAGGPFTMYDGTAVTV